MPGPATQPYLSNPRAKTPVPCQLLDDVPKLIFRQVGFHLVDQGRSKHDPVWITRMPMVKNAIPWAVRVIHVQAHAGVMAEKPLMPPHIIPQLFDDLTRKLFSRHANGKPGAMRAIDRVRIAAMEALAALTAIFNI